jgi:hypothetical protein
LFGKKDEDPRRIGKIAPGRPLKLYFDFRVQVSQNESYNARNIPLKASITKDQAFLTFDIAEKGKARTQVWSNHGQVSLGPCFAVDAVMPLTGVWIRTKHLVSPLIV